MSLRWLLWSLASPSQLLLGVTIAGALLLLFTTGGVGPPSRAARVGKALAVTGGVGLLLFGLLPTSHYLAHALETRFPIPQLPQDVAGIILLSGSERPSASDAYGEPQTGSHGSRYIAALRLAHRYPEAQFVFSGGPRTEPGKGPLETQSAVAAAILENAGLEPSRLNFESESRDSCDHPVNVRALVRPQSGEHWVVVTSAMHMPRVIGCFRAAGWPEVIQYPTDFRVVVGGWNTGTFQVAENLSLLDIALHEWVGLAYYRVTGRIAEFFPSP